MPKPRAPKLETATARLKLPVRKKPYWAKVSPNISVGYRRNQGAGTWSVRHTGSGAEWIKRLALADDLEPADGTAVLNWWQVTEAARAFVRKPDETADGTRPQTVAEALDSYERVLRAGDGNPYNAHLARIHLRGSAILTKPVSLVTADELCRWRDGLVTKGLARSSANRVRNSLRAALSLAAKRDRRIGNRHVWQDDFAALPNATVARNIIHDDATTNAVLARAYEQDHALGLFCEMVAQTAARPSQIARLEVGDLDVARSRLLMPRSAKGHPSRRTAKKAERVPVPLPTALAARLQQEAHDRPRHAPLLRRKDGQPWSENPANDYRRDFIAIVEHLGLDPRSTMYSLRHSAISRSLLRNVPVSVVSDLADTSEREIRKHYAKTLAHHADEIARRGLLQTEMPNSGNVVPLAAAKS